MKNIGMYLSSVFLVLELTLILSFSPAYAQSTYLPENVKKASQQAVVRILTKDLNGESAQYQGSGFFIGPRTVVTALHVISPYFIALEQSKKAMTVQRRKQAIAAQNPGQLLAFQEVEPVTAEDVFSSRRFYVENSKKQQFEISQVLYLSVYNDLAVLNVASPNDSFLELAENPESEHENLYMTGWHKDGLRQIKAWGMEENSSRDLIFLTYLTGDKGGLSGGPILNEKGQVVAVVSKSSFANGEVLGAKIDPVKEVLQKEPAQSKNISILSFLEELQKDLKKLVRRAEEGHANDQFIVGLFYSQGLDINAKIKDPVHWFAQAGKQRHSDAVIIWIDYLKQRISEENNRILKEEALKLSEELAEEGYVKHQMTMGQHYYMLQDMDRAFKFFKMAMDKGHPYGYMKVAQFYINKKTDEDWEKALEILSLSANQGSPEAQVKLGYFLVNARQRRITAEHAHKLRLKSCPQEESYSNPGDSIKEPEEEGLNMLFCAKLNYNFFSSVKAIQSLNNFYSANLVHSERDNQKTAHLLSLMCSKGHSLSCSSLENDILAPAN